MVAWVHDTDVVIVGAAIAGASLAHFLAPRRRTVLLEAESQPGDHSTGRSAAMFMESYGTHPRCGR
jgi:D-arginine dehydrogenase